MLADPLTGQHCSGGQIALAHFESLRQGKRGQFGWRQSDCFQEAHSLGIEVSQCLGLQAIGQHRNKKIPAKRSWRFPPEACSPSGA